MHLNKPLKILVGLGTLWLLVYPVLFIAIWLSMFIGIAFFSNSSSQSAPPFFMLPFFAIFPFQCFTILLQFVLMAFYLLHAIRNTTASEAVRIILGIGCFFIPFIAMPIYFYIYIWLETPPAWALQTQPTTPALITL